MINELFRRVLIHEICSRVYFIKGLCSWIQVARTAQKACKNRGTNNIPNKVMKISLRAPIMGGFNGTIVQRVITLVWNCLNTQVENWKFLIPSTKTAKNYGHIKCLVSQNRLQT